MGITAGAFAALKAAAFLAASALAAISAEEAVARMGAASSSLSPAPLEPGRPSRTGTPVVSKKPSPPVLDDDDVCLPTPPALDVKTEEEELLPVRESGLWAAAARCVRESGSCGGHREASVDAAADDA